MNMEKTTCQKTGTSVTYTKEITQCRECPHCKIYPDPDPSDWFNDDDEKALCLAIKDERGFPKYIEGMLRPYETVTIPEWCPLKTNK